MKTKLDDEALNLVSLAKEYSNERKARKLFESLRWPDGKPVCPHCGFEESYKLKASGEKLRREFLHGLDAMPLPARCPQDLAIDLGHRPSEAFDLPLHHSTMLRLPLCIY